MREDEDVPYLEGLSQSIVWTTFYMADGSTIEVRNYRGGGKNRIGTQILPLPRSRSLVPLVGER